MQRTVKQRRSVAVRQHEAVAVGPLGVRRIVLHQLVVEQVGDGRAAQRRAGVAAVGLLHHIHGQQPQRIDGQLIERKTRETGSHIGCNSSFRGEDSAAVRNFSKMSRMALGRDLKGYLGPVRTTHIHGNGSRGGWLRVNRFGFRPSHCIQARRDGRNRCWTEPAATRTAAALVCRLHSFLLASRSFATIGRGCSRHTRQNLAEAPWRDSATIATSAC